MAKLEPTTQEALTDILEKDISSLTDYDKAFLRARSAYLSRAQKAEYDEILNPSKRELRQEVKTEKQKEKAKEDAEIQSQKDQNSHLNPSDTDEPIG